MLKFAKLIIKFSTFSIVFYIVWVIILGTLFTTPLTKNLKYQLGGPGYMFTRMKELKQTKDIDILFLGSSHAYRGFDTNFFQNAGFKVFNLGSSAQTPIQTEFLLDKFLDSLNPKIVIFEVNPIIFSLDGIESSLDIISNGNNDFKSIKFALRQNHFAVYNTLIYSFYREIFFDEKSKYNENRVKYNDTYIAGGFVSKKLLFYKYEDLDERELEFNKNQIKSFENIINILKRRKIKLFLVQTPVTKSLYKSYSNKRNFDNEIKKYGDYYNFNERIHFDDSLHFYDADHLNQNGVRMFNNIMLETINQKE